ncbi:hypothetical protein [Magnetofaba australis]|uniref:Uncharacterized protein n=1 Tax=Magnetofaba australis IT-1 TaxID=1434232 RepID=W0LMW4_9PROT|nr:hypothetical protein [Magnetofaba australis]AHG23889.1 hypothetical protein MIIT1_02790 [Magnetofaba australis IT-1]OSM08636.1 hypothetical protein MAIT1_02790 [Magnetofaba australis IT-1]
MLLSANQNQRAPMSDQSLSAELTGSATHLDSSDVTAGPVQSGGATDDANNRQQRRQQRKSRSRDRLRGIAAFRDAAREVAEGLREHNQQVTEESISRHPPAPKRVDTPIQTPVKRERDNDGSPASPQAPKQRLEMEKQDYKTEMPINAAEIEALASSNPQADDTRAQELPVTPTAPLMESPLHGPESTSATEEEISASKAQTSAPPADTTVQTGQALNLDEEPLLLVKEAPDPASVVASEFGQSAKIDAGAPAAQKSFSKRRPAKKQPKSPDRENKSVVSAGGQGERKAVRQAVGVSDAALRVLVEGKSSGLQAEVGALRDGVQSGAAEPEAPSRATRKTSQDEAPHLHDARLLRQPDATQDQSDEQRVGDSTPAELVAVRPRAPRASLTTASPWSEKSVTLEADASTEKIKPAPAIAEPNDDAGDRVTAPAMDSAERLLVSAASHFAAQKTPSAFGVKPSFDEGLTEEPPPTPSGALVSVPESNGQQPETEEQQPDSLQMTKQTAWNPSSTPSQLREPITPSFDQQAWAASIVRSGLSLERVKEQMLRLQPDMPWSAEQAPTALQNEQAAIQSAAANATEKGSAASVEASISAEGEPITPLSSPVSPEHMALHHAVRSSRPNSVWGALVDLEGFAPIPPQAPTEDELAQQASVRLESQRARWEEFVDANGKKRALPDERQEGAESPLMTSAHESLNIDVAPPPPWSAPVVAELTQSVAAPIVHTDDYAESDTDHLTKVANEPDLNLTDVNVQDDAALTKAILHSLVDSYAHKTHMQTLRVFKREAPVLPQKLKDLGGFVGYFPHRLPMWGVNPAEPFTPRRLLKGGPPEGVRKRTVERSWPTAPFTQQNLRNAESVATKPLHRYGYWSQLLGAWKTPNAQMDAWPSPVRGANQHSPESAAANEIFGWHYGMSGFLNAFGDPVLPQTSSPMFWNKRQGAAGGSGHIVRRALHKRVLDRMPIEMLPNNLFAPASPVDAAIKEAQSLENTRVNDAAEETVSVSMVAADAPPVSDTSAPEAPPGATRRIVSEGIELDPPRNAPRGESLYGDWANSAVESNERNHNNAQNASRRTTDGRRDTTPISQPAQEKPAMMSDDSNYSDSMMAPQQIEEQPQEQPFTKAPMAAQEQPFTEAPMVTQVDPVAAPAPLYAEPAPEAQVVEEPQSQDVQEAQVVAGPQSQDAQESVVEQQVSYVEYAEIPVEGLGAGVANLLGDAVGGVVSGFGSLNSRVKGIISRDE